jgi:YidC/Oxa1 family membrane protein insertase
VNIDITYQFMIPLMQVFAKWTQSYGWAIILLTLLIRVLVWPLVASSTKSMQRMSTLQPQMKKLQEKYKDQPEVLQKKMMEFYQANKINPLGGCLPTLVQLPILIALFATFTGPPFQDKNIPVKVNLAKPAEANNVKIVSNPTSSATSPYVSPDGKLAKFAVRPGDQTLVWGVNSAGKATNEANVIDFHADAVDGSAPTDFKAKWKIDHDPNAATIDATNGQANFPTAGDVTVEAAFKEGEPIDVPVKVEAREGGAQGGNFFGGPTSDPFKSKTPQTTEQRTMTIDGQTVVVAVTPGPSTIYAGSKGVPFELTVVKGSRAGLHPVWRIVKDANAATIDEQGHAIFPAPGEVTVAAVIPGEAKNHSFYFVSSLGKVARGGEFFEPKNFDVLGMLILFAVTMYLSQMLMVQPTANLDPEQAAIQKQTQQTMPIAVTAMFFFFAMPAGVYLYLVVSNIMQTLQTWLIYKVKPSAPLTDPDEETGSAVDNNGGKRSANAGDNPDGDVINVPQKKAKKKK